MDLVALLLLLAGQPSSDTGIAGGGVHTDSGGIPTSPPTVPKPVPTLPLLDPK